MLIAVISDIHSNLEALTRTLAAIELLKADKIYCLGDIVGYGPYPNECIDLVRSRCDLVVKGNHDSGAIGQTPLEHFNEYGRAAIVWTRRVLSKKSTTFLEMLPHHRVEGDVTLAHASPASPEEWTYVFTWPVAEAAFKEFETSICFIGHTHRPLIIGEEGSVGKFKKGGRFLVNVGSVGQPRDGIPTASFALFDDGAWTCTIHRTEYDIKKTARAMRYRRLPAYLAKRLSLGT